MSLNAADKQGLAESSLFRRISLDGIEHLLDACVAREVAAGSELLRPEVQNSFLYIVLAGELRVYLGSGDLPEHAILGPGECAGELSLIDGQGVSALVIAAAPTRLLAVPHEVVWALVDRSHGVARNLLGILSGRLRRDNLTLVATQAQSLEFEQAASVDALTGVHNRRWLMEAYPRALQRADRDQAPACALMVDIDHFKRLNDSQGHLAGDAVLRSVARALAEGLRTQDLIARYGGEEFLILLPRTELDEGLLIAERLREMVATQCNLDFVGDSGGVTVSCGVAAHRGEESLDELIGRADAALRQAKENGRDRVEAAT